jgi:hypothetical protein
MAELQTTGRQCGHDLDTVADPTLPELLEGFARNYRAANNTKPWRAEMRRNTRAALG